MKKIKISMILNIIIFLMMLFATIIMFTGFKFMHGPEIVLEAKGIEMFKFFTVDSNMFMGIIALIFAFYELVFLKKKKEIPKGLYILKLMGTTAVGVTFFTVFLYLGFIAPNGIYSLILNSNLFYHLLIPVVSMLTFILFEKNELKLKDTLYGLIPTFAYSLYYIINILFHMKNGRVSPKYDWYWFIQNGIWTVIIVVPIMYLSTYLISFMLYKLNKIVFKEK